MTPRGGSRKGAGRKPLRKGEARVMVSLRLLPETVLRLQRLAEFNEVSQSEYIDTLLKLEQP